MSGPAGGSAPEWRSFLIFFVLAVAWTWPAAGADGLVGLRTDAFASAWTLDAAPRIFAHAGLDPSSAWPEGADYRRLDSWIFAMIGLLGWFIPAARLHALSAVLGVAVSAWAAHALAVRCGARPPWSWIAGISFGFSGTAATAMIEGSVYLLIIPWLPLCARGAVCVIRGPGTRRDGLIAGLGWSLSLLTSVYVGLGASVLLLAFAAAALLFRGPVAAGWSSAGARDAAIGFGAAASLGLLVWGVPWVAGVDAQPLEADALSVSAYVLRWGWAPLNIDAYGHATTAALPTPAIALAFLARRVLPGEPVVLPFALAALAGFVLALGPEIGGVPLPLQLFHLLGIGDEIQFPARFLWLTDLGAGVLGALVASRLGASFPRRATVLVAAALLHSLAGSRLPWRLRELDVSVPSAYAAARGPVLDLFPESELNGGMDVRAAHLACWYQTGHRLPIAENCLPSRARKHPRILWSREVFAGLAEERPLELPAFDAIAVHADWFWPSDRVRLLSNLTRRYGQPVESHDAGEHLVVFRLHP